MLSIINLNKRKYILYDFIRIKTRSISFAYVRFNTIISIYRLSITFRYYQYLSIITSLLHPFCFSFLFSYIYSYIYYIFLIFIYFLSRSIYFSYLCSQMLYHIFYVIFHSSTLFHMKLGQTVKLAKRFKFSTGPLFHF